jgi:hypothetical protein
VNDTQAVTTVNRLSVAPLPSRGVDGLALNAITVGSIAGPTRPESLIWIVPGVVLGLPGALLLIIVGAQVAGAATFLGLTRHALGSLGLRAGR